MSSTHYSRHEEESVGISESPHTSFFSPNFKNIFYLQLILSAFLNENNRDVISQCKLTLTYNIIPSLIH